MPFNVSQATYNSIADNAYYGPSVALDGMFQRCSDSFRYFSDHGAPNDDDTAEMREALRLTYEMFTPLTDNNDWRNIEDSTRYLLCLSHVTGRIQDYLNRGLYLPASILDTLELTPDQHAALTPLHDIEGLMAPLTHAQHCVHCNNHYSYGMDFEAVQTTDGHQSWCRSCSRQDAYYCHASSQRWSIEDFESGEDDDSNLICISFAEAHGWQYDEDGDYWVLVRSPSDYRIPDYHRATRPMMDIVPVLSKPHQRTYGIELEVEFPTSNARQKYFADCHNQGGGLDKQNQFTAEIDGSLDRSRGLEVIGGAFPLSSFYASDDANPWKRKCKELFDHGAYGWAVRAKYGMHINVDLRPIGMSLRDAQNNKELLLDRYSRLVAFFHNNRTLCQLLSGRRVIYGHDAFTEGYSRKHSLSEARADVGSSKYVPCRMRPNGIVAEVRTFGSNVRFEGILRNVEFVDSVLHYVTSSEANLFAGAGSADYRQWLLRPENANRWKMITAYLTPRAADPKLLSTRAARG